MKFFRRLSEICRTNNSLVCVGLDPVTDQFPAEFLKQTNPIIGFNFKIIQATCDLVCAYKLNSAFYEAEGFAGLDALRRTIEFIKQHGIPVILDVKRADIGSTSAAYARAAFEVYNADAVTVNPYLGGDALDPFSSWSDRGIFVLCHTSNPGSADFQTLDCGGEPLYLHVARQATHWNDKENLGLVVGATYPEALRNARQVAPDMWMLVPGVGKQGGELRASLQAGLWPDGLGMIINSSRAICMADDPRAATQALRDQINAARDDLLNGDGAQSLHVETDASTESLVLELSRIGAVRFGEFILKSGQTSPVYIDLRLLASYPDVMAKVARAYARILNGLDYDRIAAIPYAAIPIGTAVSLQTGRPLIYPRKEAKSHGTGQVIEGVFTPGDCVIVLDDLITTGASKAEAIKPLEEAGLEVNDIVVLIDRQGGGMTELTQSGYRLHSVLTLTGMMDILLAYERIDAGQRQSVLDWLEKGTSS